MTARERMKSGNIRSVNIREYIKRRLKEEGINYYELSDALGCSRANLNSGLNERIEIPRKRLEQLLWIVDGEDIFK